jgi:hypothetical protein
VTVGSITFDQADHDGSDDEDDEDRINDSRNYKNYKIATIHRTPCILFFSHCSDVNFNFFLHPQQEQERNANGSMNNIIVVSSVDITNI